MTAKELMPGMKIHTSRWGVCEVERTFARGKWLVIVIRNPHHVGWTESISKFPNSLVAVAPEEAHQP